MTMFPKKTRTIKIIKKKNSKINLKKAYYFITVEEIPVQSLMTRFATLRSLTTTVLQLKKKRKLHT